MASPGGADSLRACRPQGSQTSSAAQGSKSECPSEQGRTRMTLYDLGSEVTQCHYHHTLLVKAFIVPPRFKRGEHRPPLSEGGLENLQSWFKTCRTYVGAFLPDVLDRGSICISSVSCLSPCVYISEIMVAFYNYIQI